MNPKKSRNLCLYCKQECKRHQQIYCTNQCQQDAAYVRYIDRWKRSLETGFIGTNTWAVSNHVRRYLKEKYNDKCCRCGWSKVNPFTEKVPLQVEHLDGDYKNMKEENLEYICANCHTLTSTWGGANKGKGRPKGLRKEGRK